MLAIILVAMIAASLNYNNNLALAFAFLMSSVALVAMHHCHRNLLGINVTLNPEVETFAETVAQFDFVLANPSPVDRHDIEIHCASSTGLVPVLNAGAQQLVAVDVPVAQRGVRIINDFQLQTRYPFGWFRAWTYIHTPLTAYVAPQPLGSREPPPIASGDDDFAGLRPYQPGMPIKHMAWKVLARGGEAEIRRYTGETQNSEWLEWDALPGLSVEARLSQLCRWLVAHDSNRPYGLRLPHIEIAPAANRQHYRNCLRALATFNVEIP